ncbi:MAG: fatty acyl-AMP ligase [Armatimonadetes bacterium]|nr:fatty acyl-AMP ligase [Armatimonadota bacterium]
MTLPTYQEPGPGSVIDRRLQAAQPTPRPLEGYFPIAGYLETFNRHLAEDPSRAALYSVSTSGPRMDARPYTYEALAQSAFRMGRALEARGLRPGDRILLCTSQPEQMLACLLACWAGGYLPVPLPGIGDFALPEVFLVRVLSVADDCEPSLMLVEKTAQWEKIRPVGGPTVPVIDPPSLEAEAASVRPAQRLLPAQPRGEVAFIQYTSGSTGRPRGAVITHENLAANVKAIGHTTGSTMQDRFVTWLPLHHDMGLVGGLLFPVYWRMPTYVMSPLTFIARPSTWLRAIDRFRGTCTVAPNFAYCVCARSISDREIAELDLSTWRLAYNGAEPIDPSMMDAFVQRFAPCGFRPTSYFPVYGLAEATLAVAFPEAGTVPVVDSIDRAIMAAHATAKPVSADSPQAIRFVSVGRPMPGHRFTIQNPVTHEVLGERTIGEVVTAGPSISPRYYGHDGEDRTELRTGDLGYIADGYLYVIDRLKDLIIVAGQNFSPSDLEGCVTAVAGLRPERVVAFSTPGASGTERLHIVAELSPRSFRLQDSVRHDITRQIQSKFGLTPFDVTLVAPGQLPRTSSGKLQRSACRTMYMQGKLERELSTGARVAMHAQWMTRWISMLRQPNS